LIKPKLENERKPYTKFDMIQSDWKIPKIKVGLSHAYYDFKVIFVPTLFINAKLEN